MSESYISCLLLITTLRFTCGEKKIWYSIKKYQNIMPIIVAVELSNSATMLHAPGRLKNVRIQITYLNLDDFFVPKTDLNIKLFISEIMIQVFIKK